MWVVPPTDGRVRKLRVSHRKVLLVGGVALLIASGFLYVAGDYSRIQLVRLKDALFLKQVTAERDALKNDKASLQTTISSLEERNIKVREYEENIRTRVDELQGILHSASALGVVPPKELGTEENQDEVGGAEIDCTGGDCFSPSSSLLGRIVPDTKTVDPNLFETLDRTIDLVRSAPLGSPVNGHISSPFGMRRSPFSGRWRKHQGLDFSMPYGSQVQSTGEGVIKSVRRTKTYGLVIDVLHTNNVMTRYAHLSKAMVKKGEKICRGEAVGLVGSSGSSTGPHLHYEVHVDGKQIDPLLLVNLAQKLGDAF
ncbi:MAG: peptidoglycan DD-metalloendopeptidase family protein [Bdellovibrionales bacterium]|nr:peptidoglycan DD-metalloendopeptidase family protein [Bdellovibrionales bacterium]